MDNENAMPTIAHRAKHSEQLPPLRPRALPPVPSLESRDEVPPAKMKKKRVKRESIGDEEQDHCHALGEYGGNSIVAGVEMEGMASHRQTINRAPVTSEHHDIPPPQKKKKKKKVHTQDHEQEEVRAPPNIVNRDKGEQDTDSEEVHRKAKKKKKPKVTERQYSGELHIEDDDIITDAPHPIPQQSLFSAPPSHSQPVTKVFVERNRRFQAAERSDLAKPITHVDNYLESVWTTRDVALKVHVGFRMVGLFANGFLAGYSVWNIIIVYILAGQQLNMLSNLLEQYHTLVYPAQSLLYLLLAISTVSAFDRVNLAKTHVALKGLLTLDSAVLASILYFAALILSLSQQMTSDRINLYLSVNGTLWPTGSEQRFLHPWIVVNLVVALLVGLAWAFISTQPELDHTEESLITMDLDVLSRQMEKADPPA